jgi:single-stranded-DNA-specific exonuclease
VERILGGDRPGEKICIYGDYDVDGVASITLMRRILMAYGWSPGISFRGAGRRGMD